MDCVNYNMQIRSRVFQHLGFLPRIGNTIVGHGAVVIESVVAATPHEQWDGVMNVTIAEDPQIHMYLHICR